MRFTSVRLGVRTLLSMSGTTQQAKAVLAMQPNTRTGGSSVPLCCSPCSSLRMSRSPRPTHLRLTAIPGPPKYSDPPPATPKRWRFEQAPYPCGRATSKIDVEYVAKQFVEREGSQTDIMWSEIDLDPPDPLHSRIPDLTRRAQRLST